MDGMVERVAKAMFRSLDADPRFVGRADLTPEHPGWDQYCYQARAAIEAMMEPTIEMCDAATRSTSAFLNLQERGVTLRRLKHAIRWRAMINVAMRDTES
jgi:hypothetical protein